MDASLMVVVALGMAAGGGGAWYVARHFGVLRGLMLPVLAVGLVILRGAQPYGHSEEAMGRVWK
jgi:hypothetical protein